MVFFVKNTPLLPGCAYRGSVAVGLSLAAPPDTGLTWGAAGQTGGPEQYVSLADMALTCFLTPDKPVHLSTYSDAVCPCRGSI